MRAKRVKALRKYLRAKMPEHTKAQWRQFKTVTRNTPLSEYFR